MESILALAGLHPEDESETGFRLECGGRRIGVEACGDRLKSYGGIEDLAKRYPAERARPNSTPFRQSGRQKTFKLAVSEKRWAAIRQACKRLQRPCQVRRFE
jgi:hypothetical protein